MTATATGPSWAKGHDVARLKEITAMFKEHDQGMIHGPFGRYSEVDLVGDLERGWVEIHDNWAIVARTLDRRQTIKDFTGAVGAVLPPGTFYVSRMAWTDLAGREAVKRKIADTTLAVQAWQEHGAERQLLKELGLSCACVKISAASEMRGVYSRGAPGLKGYSPAQRAALVELPLKVTKKAAVALAQTLDGMSFADHYSGYNIGGAWAALALRGFYDDPQQIEKPTEMNKKWQGEHKADLANEPRDTPLREQLKEAESLIGAVPNSRLERVRIMRLAPGGGELARHADITDRDAGAEPGRVVRVHIPLVTNPDVQFTGWDLNGEKVELHMAVGRAYYLDTRKPHTAINGGSTERLHLVIDAVANVRLIEALAASAK